MNYLISQIKVAFEITGKITQRTEIFEYPLPALRELVLNAIIHRDYLSPIDVQIKIFDNSITFFNPGKLYGELTVEDFKTNNYQAYARNKLLSEAFYLTGDIEKYGSGFKRILNELKQYPTMKLECKEIPNGFLVELSYIKQKTILSTKTSDKVTDNLSENQIQIIRMMRQNAYITTKELSDKMKISQRKVKENIGKLKEKGFIKRIGSAKAGHWDV